MQHNIIKTENCLIILSDEKLEIGDLCYGKNINTKGYKIDIHEAGSEDLYNRRPKIIAHLPLNNSPILEGVDLLPPIQGQNVRDNVLENEVERLSEQEVSKFKDADEQYAKDWFEIGYNKAKEKYKYTEEDVIYLLNKTVIKYFNEGREYKGNMAIAGDPLHGVRRELISVVQSLQLPKYPVMFECEMWYNEFAGKRTIKTTTNSQGLTQWVGEYIY